MEQRGLSDTEREIMEVLWCENRPLTSLEIQEKIGNEVVSIGHIHKSLRSLQKNGYVGISGVKIGVRRDSREFSPQVSKGEFVAGVLEEQGLSEAALASLAISFVKKGLRDRSSENEILIKELEEMIHQYRTQEGE